MKKLIIALIIFVIMIGAAIGEIIYTSKVYGSLEEKCAELNRTVRACIDVEDTAKAESSYEVLNDYWKKTRSLNMAIGNHTVVKSIDERLATIDEQIAIGNWEDATAYVRALKEYFNDLKDDNHPSLTNFF